MELKHTPEEIDRRAREDAERLQNALIPVKMPFSDVARRIGPYLTSERWYMPESQVPKRSDLRADWCKIANGWLDFSQYEPMVYGEDPRLTPAHICELDTIEQFLFMVWNGNWNVGTAFSLGPLCFINQVLGGTEFLVIKERTAFESISAGHMLTSGTLTAFVLEVLSDELEISGFGNYRRAS